MRKISLDELRYLKNAIDVLYEEATDNSCGDPDCCGDWYYSQEDVQAAEEQINEFGLSLE